MGALCEEVGPFDNVTGTVGALCEEVGSFDNVTCTLCAICENGSSLLLDDKSGEIYAVSQTTPEYVVTIGLNCNLRFDIDPYKVSN